jgi:hypothetical protein
MYEDLIHSLVGLQSWLNFVASLSPEFVSCEMVMKMVTSQYWTFKFECQKLYTSPVLMVFFLSNSIR